MKNDLIMGLSQEEIADFRQHLHVELSTGISGFVEPLMRSGFLEQARRYVDPSGYERGIYNAMNPSNTDVLLVTVYPEQWYSGTISVLDKLPEGTTFPTLLTRKHGAVSFPGFTALAEVGRTGGLETAGWMSAQKGLLLLAATAAYRALGTRSKALCFTAAYQPCAIRLR